MVAVLAEEILAGHTRGVAPGELALLRRYQRRRKGENLLMMAAMDGFKKLFEQAEIDERNGEGRIKVVGGYDPYNDTYVISIFNQSTEDPVVVVDDDVDGGTDEGSGGDSGGGLDEGGGDGGNTDGGGGPVILLEPDSVTVDIREVLSQAPDVIRLDANNDGAVNTADLLSFLAAFGLEDFSSHQATLSSDDVTFNYDN